jgi:glycerophosphoryl diester phosphodiesterase
VIGHRGAPRLARENTVEAFAAAGRVGADMVELDVRRAPDGALLVFHDPLPDDIPPWVPSLADALAACEGMTVNVEIKNSPRDPDFDPDNLIAIEVADEIDRVAWTDRVIVSSFNLATIDAIRTRLRTAWLTLPGIDPTVAVGTTVDHGHNALHPHDTSVTAELIAEAHAMAIDVNVWTVDDHDRIRQLAGWNVDGIVTNVPDEAVALLRHHQV